MAEILQPFFLPKVEWVLYSEEEEKQEEELGSSYHITQIFIILWNIIITPQTSKINVITLISTDLL